MTIRDLANDVFIVAQHVVQNYRSDYGRGPSRAAAERVLTSVDLVALDKLVGWVFWVSEYHLEERPLDEQERRAYEAACRVDGFAALVRKHQKTIAALIRAA